MIVSRQWRRGAICRAARSHPKSTRIRSQGSTTWGLAGDSLLWMSSVVSPSSYDPLGPVSLMSLILSLCYLLSFVSLIRSCGRTVYPAISLFHLKLLWSDMLQLMILVDDAGGIIPAINHSPWDGVTLADFVMPFFLFMVGVSIGLAYKVSPLLQSLGFRSFHISFLQDSCVPGLSQFVLIPASTSLRVSWQCRNCPASLLQLRRPFFGPLSCSWSAFSYKVFSEWIADS